MVTSTIDPSELVVIYKADERYLGGPYVWFCHHETTLTPPYYLDLFEVPLCFQTETPREFRTQQDSQVGL